MSRPAPVGRLTNSKLEINVAEHCNLTCRGCSHLSPVMDKRFVDPDRMRTDLAALARHYRADQVRLVGGEPLLHPDLAAVVDAVRASGVTGRVCLVTNGLLLARLPGANWARLDAVEVSQYPGKQWSSAQRQAVRQAARAAGVPVKVDQVRRFRAPYAEAGTDDPDLVRRIYASCKIAHTWRCHTVADGYFYRCPQSYFLPKLLGERLGPVGADGLAIEDSEAFGPALAAYLASTDPPRSCTHCLGTAGRLAPHTQVRRAAFRDDQAVASEALVSPVRLRSPVILRGRRVERRLGDLVPRSTVR